MRLSSSLAQPPSYTNSAIPVHECDVTGRGTRGKMGMRCLPVHECDVTGRDAVTYRNRQDKTSDISPCPFLSSVHGPSEAGLSRAFCPPFPNLPMLGFSLGDSNILRYRAATRIIVVSEKKNPCL